MQKKKAQNIDIQKIVVFDMYQKINLYNRLNIMQLKDANFLSKRRIFSINLLLTLLKFLFLTFNQTHQNSDMKNLEILLPQTILM
jgi:uncharacterized protein YijF (DUF1287 family)